MASVFERFSFSSLSLSRFLTSQNLKNERYRFKVIVTELEKTVSLDYKVAILAFLNCLIISAKTCQARIRMRNEFIGKLSAHFSCLISEKSLFLISSKNIIDIPILHHTVLYTRELRKKGKSHGNNNLEHTKFVTSYTLLLFSFSLVLL